MKIHLQGLTEIRGIAALLVLVGHIDQFKEDLSIKTTHLSETHIAGYAVTTFFTLSGFLITYLLIREQKHTNNISTKKFYIRRILRIWPAYYLTIFLSLSFMLIGVFNPLSNEKLTISILGFVFMVPNVLYTFGLTLPATTPLWSIGVEEQFYLIWPWIMKKVRAINIILVTGVVVYVCLKISIYLVHPTGGAYALVKLTQFDCMAFGALAAIYSKSIYVKFLYHPVLQIFAVFILVSPFLFPIELFANLEIELYALASAIWILNTSMNQNSFISLNSNILRFFGKVSYGIYVYHFFWIYIFVRMQLELDTIITYLIIITTVTAFAYLSYELIEKKFLNMKSRFSVIESTG